MVDEGDTPKPVDRTRTYFTPSEVAAHNSAVSFDFLRFCSTIMAQVDATHENTRESASYIYTHDYAK